MTEQKPGIDFLKIQEDYLRSIETQDIPSGATIPHDSIKHFLPPKSQIVDFGGGSGDKADALRALGYRTALIDVNPHAVAHAQTLGISSAEVNLSNIIATKRAVQDFGIQPDAVIMEALLCNMVDPGVWFGYRFGLVSAAEVLPRGGLLFIADTLAMDQENRMLSTALESWELQKLRELWNIRYENNQALGIPKYTFLVAPPHWWKELMEYGSPDDLRMLIAKGGVERFAKHFTPYELEEDLFVAGFDQISFEFTIWKSRSGRPLSGCIIICQRR